MHYITDILYWISTGLLVPVIVLLILLFLRSLLLLGSFFSQYVSHLRTSANVRSAVEATNVSNLADLANSLRGKVDNRTSQLLENLTANRANASMIDKLMSDYEISIEADLATPKMLSKMGPMLGLMGTLIPMGPALVGLSSGDIASMAYNMQVAFATTVIGLFSAAVGYVILQVKQRWGLSMLNNMEFIASVAKQPNNQ